MVARGGVPTLSVIIPTYNERDNLDPLMREFSLLRDGWGGDFEIVLIDDNSPDGTGPRAVNLGMVLGLRVRVVTREGKRGIGSAVADGVRASTGQFVCVMDADLSHPPRVIPDLVAAIDGADGVIASRYAPGGKIISWPVRRRILSSVAKSMAGVLFDPPCLDPLSGFFLFRRSTLERIEIRGLGSKPLLEILVAGRPTVREVPYDFKDRRNGESKFAARDIMDFLRLLAVLWRTSHGDGLREPSPETQSHIR